MIDEWLVDPGPLATVARVTHRHASCLLARELPMTKRILIVDDEADIREVARVSLQVVSRWEYRASRGSTAPDL